MLQLKNNSINITGKRIKNMGLTELERREAWMIKV
tara:strand:+ start:922 stop:1026 length:105 start_codon:yes stop_codon:yes gene_type:complete